MSDFNFRDETYRKKMRLGQMRRGVSDLQARIQQLTPLAETNVVAASLLASCKTNLKLKQVLADQLTAELSLKEG